MARFCGFLVVLAALLLLPGPARAKCPPGVEFCWDAGSGSPPGGKTGVNPCWDPDLKKDICNKPPQPCPPGSTKGFTFVDDQDGTKDGQIAVLYQSGKERGCGTITVTKTAYYKIFDAELSESCTKQLDETGYVTVENSCNSKGSAVEGNAGPYYVVMDSDNTNACTKDTECKAGLVCRTGTNLGKCCVPSTPTFMGTFLLVAGEKNKICLNHWCPHWVKAQAQNPKQDPGYITSGCKGINSIHFRVDANARLCVEDTMLKPCTWGCKNGKCLPDPCIAAKCPGFCKDGVCLKINPCAALKCLYGCKNGRCLQPKSAPGEDADGDGYTFSADCDDDDAAVNPGQAEVCKNGKDDNCNGEVDEVTCGGDGPKTDGPENGGPGLSTEIESGCGCSQGSASRGSSAVMAALLVLLFGLRRTTRRQRS